MQGISKQYEETTEEVLRNYLNAGKVQSLALDLHNLQDIAGIVREWVKDNHPSPCATTHPMILTLSKLINDHKKQLLRLKSQV